MPRSVPVCYLDACVLISAIEGMPDRMPTIEAHFEAAEAGALELVTSMVTVTEVACAQSEKDRKQLDPAIEAKIEKLWLTTSPLRLIEVSFDIVNEARSLLRQGLTKGWTGNRPLDAIHLATAKIHKVTEFLTYSKDMPRWSEITGLRICPPYPIDDDGGDAASFPLLEGN